MSAVLRYISDEFRIHLREGRLRWPELPQMAGLAAFWLLILSRPSLAQSGMEVMRGLWTTGHASSCPANSYTWSGAGDDIRFQDRLGRVDAERIIARRSNGFVTITLSSSQTPVGTQWDYRIVNPDTVQVQNLSNRRSFTLQRCPEEAAQPTPSASAPQTSKPPAIIAWGPTTEAGKIGPGFSCEKATEPLGALICSSDRLAMADLAYNQVYQALKYQLSGGDQPQLRQQASEFQKQVRAACAIPRSGGVAPTQVPASSSCIEHAYDAQRSAWMRRLDPAALAEVVQAPEDLIDVQRNLQFFGYLSALEPIDGVFGTNTRDAIKAWQTATHHEVNGFVPSDMDVEMTLERLQKKRELLAVQGAGQGAASQGGTQATQSPSTAQEANRSPTTLAPDAREEAAKREASEKASAEKARQEATDRQAVEKENAESQAQQEVNRQTQSSRLETPKRAEGQRQPEPSYGQDLMSSISGLFKSGQSDLQIWQQIAKQPEQLSTAEQAENVFRCAGVFTQIEDYSMVGGMYYAMRDVMAQRVGFTLDKATALIAQGKQSYITIQQIRQETGNGTLTSEMQSKRQNAAIVKYCSEWNERTTSIFGQM